MADHLLTFDIEEWFHLVGVHAMDDRSRWDALQQTVEPLTDGVLELLARHHTRGTFFVLGWVAERYPKLIQRIAAAGHELASHSYWHYEVYKHTPASFREDLKRSIGAIGDAVSQQVHGFRAPSFSLVPGCEWAWDVMLDLGLRYDASVFPTRRAHGGYPCPAAIDRRGDETSGVFLDLPTPSGRSIAVLPMSILRLLGRPLAFSGGGYFRVWPRRLVDRGFADHDAAGASAVLYLHPWDFAPGGPSLPMRRFQRFKCYHGRASTAARLGTLLAQYRFGPCRDHLPVGGGGPMADIERPAP